ncbi:GtrA family protein [Parendozoicomonas haliclonae]|uniref:GtrA-like protein n=1 Tax=Parendozoicomonas haliclonae TaxID=1960125 RepID=A0A1X7AL92_9GAMM|nr:GtrA family protein [Parendozoicomonas haliclonae]SMA48665.1 GtrA-like protein [Parendozoicomonas haliclonae]
MSIRLTPHALQVSQIRPGRDRFLRFCLVGASGFIVDLVLFLSLTHWLDIAPVPARALAFWGAASWNWFCNRLFTFEDRDHHHPLSQWVSYLGVSLLAFCPNWGVFTLLVSFVPIMAAQPVLAMVAGISIGLIFNFILANLVVFKKI